MDKGAWAVYALVAVLSAVAVFVGYTSLSDTRGDADTGTTQYRVVYDERYGPDIYAIEGHMYLSNYHGGILHMESCPCLGEGK
jgi:hypothetical protein